MSDKDTLPEDAAGSDEGPAVILPSPALESLTGGQTDFMTPTSLIAPPLLLPTEDSADSALADRIEQALVDDGRFAPFVSRLAITVDGDVVSLSGVLPSLGLKRSLLVTLYAIPGIGDVQEHLSVVEPRRIEL